MVFLCVLFGYSLEGLLLFWVMFYFVFVFKVVLLLYLVSGVVLFVSEKELKVR